MSKHPGVSPRGEAETFEEHLLRVNPTPAALDKLVEQTDDSPVIMLNLLRFNPRGDMTIYGQYAKIAAPEVEKTGSFVGYFGKVITTLDPAFGLDDSWDGVGLVVYHRRRSFIQLQNSRNYQRAIPLRTAGVSRRTLYVLGDDEHLPGAATSIGELEVNRPLLDAGDGEVFVLDLYKFTETEGARDFKLYVQAVSPLLKQFGAVLELSVCAEIPVLSEATWDYCTLTRLPSLETVVTLYGSPAWKAVQAAAAKTMVNRLGVASQHTPIPKSAPGSYQVLDGMSRE